jgi:uncharacterized repeat protein (TIGR01451 family)
MKRRNQRALAFGAALTAASTAEAATFAVANTNDSGAGSLRQAVLDANANPGPDVITFDAGVTGTITLTTGQIVITDSVDIQGPGMANLAVSGNDASRVFYVYDPVTLVPADVTISGLTITNGYSYISGDSLHSRGAGINVVGENLTLVEVAVTDSTSGCSGGGIAFSGLTQPAIGDLTSAAIVIRSSVISGNTAGVPDQTGGGGGLYVYYAAGMTIENTEIYNNIALEEGGGISIFSGAPGAEFSISGSDILDNEAGLTGESYGFGGGIFIITYYQTLSIDETTIAGNAAAYNGGGVDVNFSTLEMKNSTVSGNTSGSGGGLSFYYSYFNYVENSTIASNYALAACCGGNGGGIYQFYGSLAIIETTISGNYAINSGGGFTGVDGATYVDTSIIAGNQAGTNPDIDLDGNEMELFHSLVEVPSGPYTDLGGNIFNQPAQLGPLQDNGGPTFTMMPELTSPAVNAVDPANVAELPRDQRGFTRPVGFVDMGAVELQAGTVQFAQAAETFAESAGTVTISVTRTGEGSGDASVLAGVSGGTATGGNVDYGFAGTTLNWAHGETGAKTFDIDIVDDNLFEGDETIVLQLSNPTVVTLGTPSTEIVTIDENEPLPSISIQPLSQNEGDAGTSTFTFNVSLSGPSVSPISVNFTTLPNEAAEGADFLDNTGTITFPAGTIAQTVGVTVNGDNLVEGNETFTVVLSNPNNATIAVPQAAGTIVDDDTAGTLQFAVNAATFNESAGTVAITVTRTGGGDGAASVQVSVNAGGTATGGGVDYTFGGTTLNWADQDTDPKTFNITIGEDALFEGDESFVLQLSNATGASIGAPATEAVTITDNEAQPSFSIQPVSQVEGDAGTSTFTFTVTLSGVSESPTSVDFTTTQNSATEGVDYLDSSGTLNFPGGSTVRNIEVTVNGDNAVEANETFDVELSDPAGATIATPEALGTIVDDDQAGQVQFALGGVTVNEAAGTITVNVNRTAGSDGPASVQVTVNPGGTATGGGADYTFTGATLTWPDGDTTPKSFTVDIINDNIFEPDESFVLQLGNAAGAAIGPQSTHTVTIDDNEAQPTFSIAPVSDTEGNAGPKTFTFNVTLSGPSASPASVNFTTTPNDATEGTDYLDSTGTLNFAPLATSMPINVTVNGDTAIEPDETFDVELSNAAGAAIATPEARGTVVNDDVAVDADLQAEKTLVSTGTVYAIGDTIVFRVRASNSGPATASNVVVTDTLPAQVQFVSATPSQGTCNGTTVITCSFGAIAGGGEATVDITVRAIQPGEGTNTASVVSATNDPAPANNSGNVAFAVSGAAGAPALDDPMLLLLAALLGATGLIVITKKTT